MSYSPVIQAEHATYTNKGIVPYIDQYAMNRAYMSSHMGGYGDDSERERVERDLMLANAVNPNYNLRASGELQDGAAQIGSRAMQYGSNAATHAGMHVIIEGSGSVLTNRAAAFTAQNGANILGNAAKDTVVKYVDGGMLFRMAGEAVETGATTAAKGMLPKVLGSLPLISLVPAGFEAYGLYNDYNKYNKLVGDADDQQKQQMNLILAKDTAFRSGHIILSLVPVVSMVVPPLALVSLPASFAAGIVWTGLEAAVDYTMYGCIERAQRIDQAIQKANSNGEQLTMDISDVKAYIVSALEEGKGDYCRYSCDMIKELDAAERSLDSSQYGEFTELSMIYMNTMLKYYAPQQPGVGINVFDVSCFRDRDFDVNGILNVIREGKKSGQNMEEIAQAVEQHIIEYFKAKGRDFSPWELAEERPDNIAHMDPGLDNAEIAQAGNNTQYADAVGGKQAVGAWSERELAHQNGGGGRNQSLTGNFMGSERDDIGAGQYEQFGIEGADGADGRPVIGEATRALQQRQSEDAARRMMMLRATQARQNQRLSNNAVNTAPGAASQRILDEQARGEMGSSNSRWN